MTDEADVNIENAVSAWVEKNGIGFELKVASLVKTKFKGSQIALSVTHSRQYEDFDEEQGRTKLREVDLVAQITKQISRNFFIHTWLIVECKSHSNPFVLYKNTEPSVLRSFQPLGDIWHLKKSGELLLENIHGATTSGFLDSEESIWCYSINSKVDDKSREEKNRNLALEGFWQVNSAVKGIMKQAVLTPTVPRELHIFIPVLATTAPLVNLRLNQSGEISQQRTHRELLVSQPHHDSGKPLGTWVVDYVGLDGLIDDWIAFHNQLDYRESW